MARRGYQPAIALWAEEDVILVDEFRYGNVSASTTRPTTPSSRR